MMVNFFYVFNTFTFNVIVVYNSHELYYKYIWMMGVEFLPLDTKFLKARNIYMVVSCNELVK